MKNILQLLSNAWDFILVFVVLCITHFDGEDEVQETETR